MKSSYNLTVDEALSAIDWWNGGNPVSDSFLLESTDVFVSHLRRFSAGGGYLASCDIIRDGLGYGSEGYGRILIIESTDLRGGELRISGVTAPHGGSEERILRVCRCKPLRKGQNVTESKKSRKTDKITSARTTSVSGV